MTRIAILAAALLTGAALPAAAQDAAPATPAPEAAAPADTAAGPSHKLTGPAIVFNLIDADRNGAISRQEADALFETVFVTLDGNDDGELSKDEINAALAQLYGHGGRDRDRGDDGDVRRGGEHRGGNR